MDAPSTLGTDDIHTWLGSFDCLGKSVETKEEPPVRPKAEHELIPERRKIYARNLMNDRSRYLVGLSPQQGSFKKKLDKKSKAKDRYSSTRTSSITKGNAERMTVNYA